MKEPEGEIVNDLWRVYFTQELLALRQLLDRDCLTEKQASVLAIRMHKLQEILFGGP